MNPMSPEPPAAPPSSLTANPYPVPQAYRALTRVAWSTTILASALPDIACAELAGGVPGWLVFAKMGGLLLLAASSVVWTPLRPLRAFFIVLLAFFGLAELRPLLNFTVPDLQTLLGNSVFDARMQAEQTGKLEVSLAMISIPSCWCWVTSAATCS